MAVLKSDKLSLDFRYQTFFCGYVHYEFYFRWEDESIIKDSILKRDDTFYWRDRPESSFVASEEEKDGLIPLLKKVLETDEADYWEPYEPDIIIAIYPDTFFPFLHSHYKLIHQSKEIIEQNEAFDKKRKEKGKQPDDLFTLIVFVDSFNFKNNPLFGVQGVALHMLVERHELELFLKDLEEEYKTFYDHYRIDEWRRVNADRL